MRFVVDLEDNSISAADIRAVLTNSPLDLGWLTVEEEAPAADVDLSRAEDEGVIAVAATEYRRAVPLAGVEATERFARVGSFTDGWRAAVRFLKGSAS